MKYIFITLILAAVLFSSSSAFKKKQLRDQVIHEFEKHDLTKTCITKQAARCVGKVSFWDLNYLRKQVSKAYKKYKEFKDSPDDFKDYLKNFKKDDKTGDFWKCVLKKLNQNCEDEEFLSLKNSDIMMMDVQDSLHYYQEDEFDGEGQDKDSCLEEQGQKCVKIIGDDKDKQLLVQKQADEIKQLYEDGADAEAIGQKMDELEANPETGEFWSCALSLDEACGYEEDPQVQCYQENGKECLDKVEDPAVWDKIDAQGEELDEIEEDDEEAAKAKMEELKNDPETGAFWACQFDLYAKCG